MDSLMSVENPWDVNSIYDFNYFCCPECDIKSKTKQDFVDHASSTHPKAIGAFQSITDGSLNDVQIPALSPNVDLSEETKDLRNEDFLLYPDNNEDEPLARRKKSYICEMCNFRAKNSTIFQTHMKKVHQTHSALTCPECKEVFSSGHTLKVHLWNIHQQGKSSEKCLCSLCGKTIIGRSNFKKHEREKHGIITAAFVQRRKPTKIQCEKCLVNFDSPKSLDEHWIACYGESRDFRCPQCDLYWSSGPSLNAHLKIDHNVPEMYTCSTCGKCLKKKASLESHVKVEHEKIKDHICHLCGSSFARAQGLRFHMQRVHEHSGKYACEYCNFRTVAQMQLDIHVNAVHTKSKKFSCNECNFFCYHRQGLLAHVKTVHLKLKPHQCLTCHEAYVRRKDLEKHKETTGH